ncbi:MAG TPA: hypothetical protein VGC41_12540 [Kofleriaceae bacterium]
MSKVSTTSWILHNLALATSIGGTLFGQGAFQPALEKDVEDEQQRARVSDDAWSRYSWWNLASHGLVAVTWLAGRTLLSGREVSGKARALTHVKDVLVVASLLTGVSSVIVGKTLGEKAKAQQDEGRTSDATVDGLRRAVKTLGIANIAANAATGAVTTMLSMEGAKSLPFAAISRLLP